MLPVCVAADRDGTAHPVGGGVVSADALDSLGLVAAIALLAVGWYVVVLLGRREERRDMLRLLTDLDRGLRLYDEKGKLRATLLLDPGGSPVLALHDEKGKADTGLSLLPEGSPGLWLYDDKDMLCGTLLLDPGGTPVLRLNHYNGAPRARLGPSLTLFGVSAKQRIVRNAKVIWCAP